MSNQVVLTFGADTKQAEDGFSRVGAASKRMSESTDEASNGFERVGGSADNAERNIIGVHDVIDGTATIMQGPGKQGIVAYLQGWADLAGGIGPMAEYISKTRVATLAQAAAAKVAALGTNIWTGAQRLLSLAFISSPIGWIVLGIGALIAVIVLIATKTTWFQTAWRVAWSAIKNVASSAWDFIKQIPGWIGSAFSKVASFITAPFRGAFNFIADAWNNTIGRLSWSVPGWVPGIGGNTISVPHLPHFHSGGVVPGPAGSEVPIMALAGERVLSTSDRGGDTVYVRGDGLVDTLIELISQEVGRRGGNAQLVLGGRNG